MKAQVVDGQRQRQNGGIYASFSTIGIAVLGQAVLFHWEMVPVPSGPGQMPR
jgi:hypothetical protein